MARLGRATLNFCPARKELNLLELRSYCPKNILWALDLPDDLHASDDCDDENHLFFCLFFFP